MPSAVKKAIAAAMSSTTTLTWSNLLIVMSLAWQRPCAAEDGQLLAAGVGSATDAVADVCGLRRVDHADDLQLDARRQHLEQPTATTEQHRNLVYL